MIRFPRWKFAATMMLVLGAVLALSACSSNVKSETVAKAKAAGKFDVVVQAYKSGQFLLDGAVLSSLDLSSHFAYLRDQGKLPETVLLEPSDESDIRDDHLRYMASMAYTYGFTVYYVDDGQLRQIVPTASDKTKLKGSPRKRKSGHPHVERHDASHGSLPGLGQRQRQY